MVFAEQELAQSSGTVMSEFQNVMMKHLAFLPKEKTDWKSSLCLAGTWKGE